MNIEIGEAFYSEISIILNSARQKAYVAINYSMIKRIGELDDVLLMKNKMVKTEQNMERLS